MDNETCSVIFLKHNSKRTDKNHGIHHMNDNNIGMREKKKHINDSLNGYFDCYYWSEFDLSVCYSLLSGSSFSLVSASFKLNLWFVKW